MMLVLNKQKNKTTKNSIEEKKTCKQKKKNNSGINELKRAMMGYYINKLVRVTKYRPQAIIFFFNLREKYIIFVFTALNIQCENSTS